MSCLFFNPTDVFLYAGNKCAIFVDIVRLTVIVLGIDSTHVIMPFSLNTFKCDATDDVDLYPVRSQISLTVGGKP